MESIPYSVETYFNDPNFPISPEPTAPIELQPCPICTRKFVPATLTKHIGICERMATKKRKKFDSFRQRREGTDLAAYLPKNFGLPTTTTTNNTTKKQTFTEPKILSPKIQVQESTPVAVHKEFETDPQISQSTQKKSTLNPISPTSKQVRPKNVVKRLAPASEQCPYCGRSFGIKAFDRHVDWCKEKSRLQQVKNNADVRTAKERLDARTKYRAPNLKAKREAIRYKYSGNGDDGHSIDETRSVDNNILSMSNSLSSSFMSDGPPEDKKVLSNKLSLKSQKINTESEATINVKNKDKPLQKTKTSNVNAKKKKQPLKTDQTKAKIKKSVENEENSIIQNEEFNLIGLSLTSFDNESEIHEISNDEINSCKNTPMSDTTEEIFNETIPDFPISDRIEIEEIIPLNSNQCLNFDDTPIRPAKSIILNKPINDIDEIPIRPSKKILNDKPTLTLPIISVNKTDYDSINNSPNSSAKSYKEKPLNEIVKKTINDDTLKDNFDEMPIGTSKTLSNTKRLLPVSSSTKTKDIIKDTQTPSPVKENIVNDLDSQSLEKIADNNPKDNFDDIPIRPAKIIVQKNSVPNLPKISTTNIKKSKSNLSNSSANLTVKETPRNETPRVENPTESANTITENKPPFDEVKSTKKILNNKNKSKNLNNNSQISSEKSTMNKITEPFKTAIEDKSMNNFDDMPIRPSKSIFNETEDCKNDQPICSPKLVPTQIEYAKSNSSICSPISVIKEKPVNEFVENLTSPSITVIEENLVDNYDGISSIPLTGQSLESLNDEMKDNIVGDNIKRKNTNKSPIASDRTKTVPKINAPFQSPKKILKVDSTSKTINSSSYPTSKDMDICIVDINQTLISSSKDGNLYENKKTIKKSDKPNQILKTTLKDTSKNSISGTDIRANYINNMPSNLLNNSYPINSELDNIKPIRTPKAILRDNSSNHIGDVAIHKSKPILRNRAIKSANDIPNKSTKSILKDSYTNNFNQVQIRSSKTINNASSSALLPKICNKKVEEVEMRPLRKLSLKTILPPINRPSVASLSSEDFDKLLSSSDLINGRRESQTSFEFPKKSKKLDDKISLPKVFSRDSLKTSSLNDGSENFWMEISYGAKSGRKIERPNFLNKSLNEENYNLKSGFSDKYDPFLSAKRQLEELCSPTAEAESPFSKKQYHPTTSTPITIKPKVTSSLSTSYTAPSPNPRNTLNSVKTNFRRTSSLRSPRKSTPCPRPLYRPTTIQRGISDEGPISTNFIRPEEYDEMPVKSACINNFATSINSPQFARRDSSPQKLLSRSTSRESSPLVVKRDPNSNLNRRNLRLNLGNNKELNNSSSNNIPVLKTDSLAVFLKYENDLMKNPSDKLISALNQKINTTPIVLPQQNTTTTTLPVSNLISEKEWKDKSNTLSKQSSLKNSSSDLVEKTFGNVEKEKLTLLKNSLTNLLDSNSGNNNNKVNDIPKKLPPTVNSPPDVTTPMPSVNKSLPIKLEPLHQQVYKNTYTPPPSKTQSPPVVTSSLAPLFPQIKSTPMTVAINNNLINLNSILNIDSKQVDNNNFIDPKLINKCDNLHVIATTSEITKLSDDSDLTSGGSQDSAYRPKTVPDKLTDDRHSSGHQSSESVIEKSPSPPTTLQRKEQYQRQTSSNRNSSDKKNLLKRQIRLGKNQFLYDASPSDTEPSPDPIINKSHDDLLSSNLTTTHLPLVESSEKQFDSLLSPSNNPIFNDFDFEEFLSSFEASNDDDEEQFPGFKDCKEFLMNRCLNMRSMNFINNNSSNIFNNTQNLIRSRKIDLDPMMMLNDSSTNINNNRRQSSHDDDDDVQIVHDEREIFISIETDQNENETSNPCPNDPSIQNPKIEEIIGNDNKFTKIETYHLPIFEEKDENLTTDFINDVTIRRNNVKNKQQHGNKKDNITCDSVTSMYPVDSDERSSVECYPIGRRSVKSKTSADSAYGSLSRQSPTLTDRSSVRRNSASRNNNRLPSEQINSSDSSNVIQQSNDSGKCRNRELSASSSGSENSLPPINSHNRNYQQQNVLSTDSNMQKDSFNTTTVDGSNFSSLPSPTGQQQQMSKFCHECGSRFLVAQAKFCMDCGIKRIILK